MIIIPAIDLKDGKVVRLKQGKFEEVTIYSQEPIKIAQKWQEKGATIIHVVDLDGAQKGELQNVSLIKEIAKSLDIPVQMGGGIRKAEDIEQLLSNGINRVVLGTKAIEDRTFLKEIIDQWQERIIVSLDCTNGMVAQRGWTSVSELKAIDFIQELENLGLSHFIYTDISRDGMLTGPNLHALKEILRKVSIPVIASGGVSHLDDIRELKKLEPDGLMGAIVGKALYEGKFDLKTAIDLCSLKG